MTPIQSTLDPETARERRDETPFPDAASDGVSLRYPTARGTLRPTGVDGAIGATGSLACPACGGETVNGAGLFACERCEWTGTIR